MTLQNIWKNPIMMTDVYNLSHWYLKKDVSWDISHIYNRKQPMVLYGFNEIVEQVCNRKIYDDDIQEAAEYADKMNMGPFPIDMWMIVAKDYKGRLPLRVDSLPEGTWVPKGTPFAKIRNTEEDMAELVTWFEGMFLHASFPSGCATRAAYMRQYLIDQKCQLHRFHNFGFRGHNSMENFYWGSTAWNLFLTGTDDFASKYHTPKAPISSIPASAHKVEQQFVNELDGYLWQIEGAKKNGKKILALVIDTYDANRFITKYLDIVTKYAQNRGIHIVYRPDSGNTLDQAISIHNLAFNRGYKNVSTIIGEGMTFEKAKEYDKVLFTKGVPLDFVAYGIGAGFYKDIDRDYLGFAMKTARSAGHDVMKFSNDAIKQSIPGDISLIRHKTEQGNPTSHMVVTSPTSQGDLYQTIYDYNQRSTRPEFKIETWDEIYSRCKTLVPDEHASILIGYDIQDRIKECRKLHGLE